MSGDICCASWCRLISDAWYVLMGSNIHFRLCASSWMAMDCWYLGMLRSSDVSAEMVERFDSCRSVVEDLRAKIVEEWKKEFEQRNGRGPTKADIMLADPEIMGLARRLGEFS